MKGIDIPTMPSMGIPASRWYPVIETRRSRRKFDGKPLKNKQVKALEQACESFRPYDSARVVLVNQSADSIMKGVIGSYGKIKGAPAFLTFIGDRRDHRMQERLGYTGEGIILEAEAMKLNTCWVGGSFKAKEVRSMVELGDRESIMGIAAVGVASERPSFEERVVSVFGLTHRRKHLVDMAIGLAETRWPEWVKAALEAARLAPSAYNRQPWRFHVMEDGIAVATSGGETKIDPLMSTRLDCGIAMMHIEVAALKFGIRGHWEFHNPPLVAKFII